jgi:CRP-like cAMP-binding protein
MSVNINLRDVILFSRLSDQALEDVASALIAREMNAGEILFNKGDIGDELVIVEEGSVAIFMPIESGFEDVQPIRVFHPGEMLGEMALIDQKPRSLSARAESSTRILTLSGSDFRRILEQNPKMAISVMAGLNDRIRYTTEFLGEVRGWVQRMAEGDYRSSALMDKDKYGDQTLSTLAAEFAQMAARVQEREDILRKEVAQLRIEIDEAKRKQEVQRIVGSEYYQSLKERAKELRKRNE